MAAEFETPAKLSPRKRQRQNEVGAAFFGPRGIAKASASNPIPSSSPAFATPIHPLKPFDNNVTSKSTILPIVLPPAILRPLAFRTFTKKHSLTLTSSALQELATFVGRHCGSGWREEGLAEKVLEEVAKSWKNRNGGVIVDGASPELKDILKTLEANMSGGKVMGGPRGMKRQNSLLLEPSDEPTHSGIRLGLRPAALARNESTGSLGLSSLAVDEEQEDGKFNDARQWLKVVGAFDQPRMLYNVAKRHFERDTSKPSLLPPALHKTTIFRNRFNVIHQRLLRNESFQRSAVAEARAPSLKRSNSSLQSQETFKITPIANLLGRHGTYHMLLGLLSILPAGELAICDLTGSIALDISRTVCIPADSAWFTPGMIVIITGIYEEEEESSGRGLNSNSGVGGTIGGRFQGFFIGQPPCEKRKATLGVSGPDGGQDHTIGGGFGWIDFLGVGSERAVGPRMRRLEQRLIRQPAALAADADAPPPPSRARIVILGELTLDQPRTLQALSKILATYNTEPEGHTPLAFVLAGNFTTHAAMAGAAATGSIEYKEHFDALASTLADYPALLRSASFIFVPGDNDGWASAYSAGAAAPLPRDPIPDVFTSRIRRAFATANTSSGGSPPEQPGEAVWTTNPARLSLFGPSHEIVLFRDDISARLRRTAIRMKASAVPEGAEDAENQPPSSPINVDAEGDIAAVDKPSKATDAAEDVPYDVHAARKLVKTVLDQGYLAPFRPAVRPLHWDHASALHLYPLPTAMVLADTTAPAFCVTYEGCHVMNPGSLLVAGRRGVARWIEYEIGGGGTIRECLF